MQISSRFTVALHIFTCVETFKDDYKVTSDFLAGSIGTNPVIIRKILTQVQSLATLKMLAFDRTVTGCYHLNTKKVPPMTVGSVVIS